MLHEGYYALIAASGSHSDHDQQAASQKDATSNNGNKKGLNKTTQQENRHRDPKMDTLKDAERLTEQLLKKIGTQQSEIDILKSQIKMSKERSDIIAKRSSEITKGMAKVMDTSGNFENVNDGRAKLDIADKFSNVYDREWVILSRWLAKQFPKISEIDLINSLTSLMKMCYKECVSLADKQVRQFLFLDESQSTPPPENNEELYAVRKQYAQTDTVISSTKQVVLRKVNIDDEMSGFLTGDSSEETRKLINEFLHNYLKCCWLMVVSNPPLALNFDVVGKQYCKEHFKVYSAKQRLADDTCDTNTVHQVVWPCVYYADRSFYFKKGDALLGTKDAKATDDVGTAECTCFTTDEDNSAVKTSKASLIKDASISDKGSSSLHGTGTVV